MPNLAADVTRPGSLFCSFCGKSQHEVKKLIVGPASRFHLRCLRRLCVGIIDIARPPVHAAGQADWPENVATETLLWAAEGAGKPLAKAAARLQKPSDPAPTRVAGSRSAMRLASRAGGLGTIFVIARIL
jgi:hypothetical protein